MGTRPWKPLIDQLYELIQGKLVRNEITSTDGFLQIPKIRLDDYKKGASFSAVESYLAYIYSKWLAISK